MSLRNSNYNKVITRNYTNDSNVQLSSVPESGFDMSYGSRASGFVLGRIYPFTRQRVMPHDTFTSTLSGALQMEDMATPYAPDMSIHAFTAYCSDRAVNADFDELMSPRVLNNYSASAELPMFSPSAVCGKFMEKYLPLSIAQVQALVKVYITKATTDATAALTSFGITTDTTLLNFINKFAPTSAPQTTLRTHLAWSYADDATYDLQSDAHSSLAVWKTYAAVSAAPYEFCVAVWDAYYRVLGAYFGKTSVMDMFGYPYVNPYLVRTRVYSTAVSSANTFAKMAKLLLYGDVNSTNPDYCNEHMLRKWFALYVEFLRNTQLEPNKVDFNYRKFTSTSKLAAMDGTAANSQTPLAFICPRCIPFEEDLYTSLLTDNPCMHAYAPIIAPTVADIVDDQSNTHDLPGYDGTTIAPVLYNSKTMVPASTHRNKTDDVRETMQSLTIDYYDQATNTEKQVQTYLPSNMTRFMSSINSSTENTVGALKLDFGILRESKQLEKFLKIKYFFSDEYKDELSAIYMVDLADANLFRPKLYGGSSNTIGVDQTTYSDISTDSNGENLTTPNTRGTIGNSNLPNVTAHDFVEEYGDVWSFGWISVKPSYDPSFRPNMWRKYQDFPNPIFAPNNESIVYNFDLSRSGDATTFAHAPYHFEMRSRVDELHGDFADALVNCNMPRLWTSNANFAPKFNYAWLHQSGLPVGFMRNARLTDGQYRLLMHDNFVVQRLLPSPIETL